MSSTRQLLTAPFRKALNVIVAIPVAAVGLLIFAVVEYEIDHATTEFGLEDAKANHARFEGTWTPGEMRVRRFERVEQKRIAAEQNHATVEGYV